VKNALAIVVLLAVGCGQSGLGSRPQVATATAVATPQPGANAWPLVALSLSRVDFTCRLPVLDFATPGISDAFIEFPAATFTPAGSGGWHYDWTVGRWLPVARREASPDGRRYAIAKGWALSPPSPTRIHIVDAATSADLRVATMPDNREYGVIDFTSSGVTVIPIGQDVAPEAGVWTLNPDTGALTKTSDGYYQPPVGEWIGVVDPRDPNHQFSHATGVPVAQPDRIDRRDGNGGTTTWIYKPGWWLYWFAFEGSPLLLVEASQGTSDYEYWLVSGPGQSTRLAGYSGTVLSPYRDLVFTTGMPDEHGIWLSGAASIYLVRRDGSILLVAGHGGVPAGACA
jgi:hypothetical protein